LRLASKATIHLSLHALEFFLERGGDSMFHKIDIGQADAQGTRYFPCRPLFERSNQRIDNGCGHLSFFGSAEFIPQERLHHSNAPLNFQLA
jgi:hypothetical protein